jgi:uncharacterized membrane protein
MILNIKDEVLVNHYIVHTSDGGTNEFLREFDLRGAVMVQSTINTGGNNMNHQLQEILQQQNRAVDLLEAEIKRLENLDLAKQNAALEKEAVKLNMELESLRNKISELTHSNSELREALYSRLYGEKLNFIDNSQKKMNAYFSTGTKNEYNRLVAFENKFKQMIDTRLVAIRGSSFQLDSELNTKIDTQISLLMCEIHEAIAAAKTIGTQTADIRQTMNEGYQAFRDEGVSEQEVRNIAGQNKLERFLGLNIISKIGIGLIILGVIFASQYTYRLLDDGMKSLLIFVLGGAMIGTGEFLGRKKANVFSLVVVAGGIAVTYTALTVSYFTFNLFSPHTAAIICVVITAAAFFLSIRHNSQVIATFSLIGGFLPIMTIDGALDYVLTYSAMAYFVILGGFALVLSFRKKWLVTAFFGLSLNTITTIYIATFFSPYSPTTGKIVLFAFMAVSFLIYTLIPIIGTYSGGLSFKTSDVTLITLNTFLSTIIMYFNFHSLEIVEFNGLIPLVFMLIYVGLWLFIRLKMHTERNMQALFFITSVVFFALIVPMHFDVMWLTFGWLLQGVGLCLYGILADKRKFTISGFVINGLCLFSFLIADLMLRGGHFELKYLLITLSAIAITAAYAYKHAEHGGVKALKYLACINLWGFLLYIIGRWNDVFLSEQFDWFTNLYSIICVPTTLIFAAILPRIKAVYDSGMRVISHIIAYSGLLWLFILNFSRYESGEHFTAIAFAFAVVNLLSVFALADVLNYYFKRNSLRSEWFPFLLSCYFMVILTQQLLVLYRVPFAGMAISLVYAGLALAWCIFGFWKRFTFMRRLGLGLTLVVVCKLFIIDLWRLTEGYRIITYFVLGAVLLGISFVYQHFTKKLESGGK